MQWHTTDWQTDANEHKKNNVDNDNDNIRWDKKKRREIFITKLEICDKCMYGCKLKMEISNFVIQIKIVGVQFSDGSCVMAYLC